MMGAFAGHYDVKHVIVVDEDVDIHDPAEVEWAVATRFQADRDLVIVRGAGSKLDPSTRNGVGAKMGMDATIPLAAPPGKYTRIRVRRINGEHAHGEVSHTPMRGATRRLHRPDFGDVGDEMAQQVLDAVPQCRRR